MRGAGKLFSIIYALMVEQMGTVAELEEWLEERAKEWDLARARVRNEVPESVANDMRSLMVAKVPRQER